MFLDIFGRVYAAGSNKLGRLGINKDKEQKKSIYYVIKSIIMLYTVYKMIFHEI